MDKPDIDRLALLHTASDAEETVRAIYQGAVDAVVVQGRNGPQIVTLSGADEPYRVLVERMTDGALTVSTEGLILYVNRRLSEMTGEEAGALIGKQFASLFADVVPDDISSWTQPADGGVHYEANLARGAAESLPVSVWAGPVALGDRPAALVTISDLSVQRRADEIAVAERFARSILEQATDAILVLDPSGRITHASWAAEQLVQTSPIGRQFSDAFPLVTADPTQAGALERYSAPMLDSLLATRPFHGLEVRLRGRESDDSNARTFLLSAGPLLDQAKQVVGSIVTLTDISARKRAEEQQTMLVAELNHRVKNILAIVQSIATQTVRNTGSLDGFKETFGGRLRALSVAHDVLTKTRWGGVEVTQLLKEIMSPYRERVSIEGPPLVMSSQSIVPLSMVLHELMTNAAKYGALSSSGHILLTWQKSEAPATVQMVWQEEGGPRVAGGTRRGFGTKLIERVMSYDLEGSAGLDFQPSGLVCTLSFPIAGPRFSLQDPPASTAALG